MSACRKKRLALKFVSSKPLLFPQSCHFVLGSVVLSCSALSVVFLNLRMTLTSHLKGSRNQKRLPDYLYVIDFVRSVQQGQQPHCYSLSTYFSNTHIFFSLLCDICPCGVLQNTTKRNHARLTLGFKVLLFSFGSDCVAFYSEHTYPIELGNICVPFMIVKRQEYMGQAFLKYSVCCKCHKIVLAGCCCT